MQWDSNAALFKVARSTIRKESNSTYNRLHSIFEDANFVTQVKHFYVGFKMYANLRCGAWYVDQAIADPNPVYFKSTDGHFGQWAFNLRRVNLHLLRNLILTGGVIIVDSTRQGKRLPDALAKTIPMWCAVINLAVLKSSGDPSLKEGSMKWGLHTPPSSVSKSEHSQIEQRLDHWAEQLLNSEFTIPSIRKPLRPIWITPDSEVLPSLDLTECHPVICVSASKLVAKGLERRAAGYTYVQGSGDDHESWSFGLTPDMFWKHKEQLCSCPSDKILDLIRTIVRDHNYGRDKMILPVKGVQSRVHVGTIPSSYTSLSSGGGHILITRLSNAETLHSDEVLHLKFALNKKGQTTILNEVLPQSMVYLKTHLDRNQSMAILCQDGKDFSVGIALTALTLFFDDNGNFIQENQHQSPTKSVIQRRLQWILADNPYANPSRNTLKRVNEYLMSQPRRLNTADATVK